MNICDIPAKLIVLVKSYPCLYDNQNSNYFNRHVRNNAWAQIANKLSLTIASAQTRWKSLRDKYRKKKNQKLEYEKCGTVANWRPKWELFEAMTFLEPFLGNKLFPENASGRETLQDSSSQPSTVLSRDSATTSTMRIPISLSPIHGFLDGSSDTKVSTFVPIEPATRSSTASEKIHFLVATPKRKRRQSDSDDYQMGQSLSVLESPLQNKPTQGDHLQDGFYPETKRMRFWFSICERVGELSEKSQHRFDCEITKLLLELLGLAHPEAIKNLRTDSV